MEKRKEFIINTAYVAVICALIYIGINYLLGILFPFIMAFLFSYLSVNIAKKIFKDDKKLHRGIILALIYIVIIFLLALLISLGINKVGDFIKTLPTFYRNTIDPYINTLESAIVKAGESLPESLSASFSQVADGLFDGVKNLISSLTGGFVNLTTSIITSTPEALVSIIVTIVASFYMIFDYEGIAKWFTTSIPAKYLAIFYEIKDFCENRLFKILGSYITIMAVTFAELFLGFSIIGISNSGMWAFVIALLDIFPILGVGTVLIPWGISSIITGRVFLGIALLVLYLIITVVRNFVEPKLVGTNLGLHPLATLISMIVGLRLFSIVGMFGLPLALSFFATRSKKEQ